jgi:hypothetical protein
MKNFVNIVYLELGHKIIYFINKNKSLFTSFEMVTFIDIV